MSTLRWYRINFPCPECERLPALRLSDWLVAVAKDAVARDEDDRPVIDYQCSRPTCKVGGKRTTFVLSALVIARAEPMEGRDAA